MLKKQFRLKKNSAFTATYKLKNSMADDYLIVYLGKKKESYEIPTKAAFVVSKKIHKRAVKRNRIKRLVREAYRLAWKDGELDYLSKYLSVIVLAKNKALDADYSTLKSSLLYLLKKLVLKVSKTL